MVAQAALRSEHHPKLRNESNFVHYAVMIIYGRFDRT